MPSVPWDVLTARSEPRGGLEAGGRAARGSAQRSPKAESWRRGGKEFSVEPLRPSFYVFFLHKTLAIRPERLTLDKPNGGLTVHITHNRGGS